jgi:predicted ABC-type ATPase
MADRQDHQLTEAQNEQIFRRDILPYLLATSGELKPSEAPVMVIVGGQPGAGKSRSIDSVKLDLTSQGGVLEIAADDLRKFHPKNDELMMNDDRTAADFTHSDASLWAEKAERFARDQRYNVLLEGTLKTPDNAAAKLAEYRQAGYFIEARIIAVHERSSWQGVVSRYEQQRADAGAGRMTPKPVHDAAVRGILITIEKIETEKLVDRVRIDRRGAEQIYSNALSPDGEWQSPPGGAKAITAERDRPLTAPQWDAFVAGLDRIDALQNRHGRHASLEELLEVRQLREMAVKQRDLAVISARDLDAAARFKTDPPELAAAKHPKLVEAYAVLSALEKHAQSQGIQGAKFKDMQTQARALIASNIAAGRYPVLNTREQAKPQKPAGVEVERSR